MKIYVGNLSRDVTEDELRQEFEPFGKADSVTIVRDRYSGQPRGFGFVEMPTKAEAHAAIAGLNGKTLGDRTLNVSEARPPSDTTGSRRGGLYSGGGRRTRY